MERGRKEDCLVPEERKGTSMVTTTSEREESVKKQKVKRGRQEGNFCRGLPHLTHANIRVAKITQ